MHEARAQFMFFRASSRSPAESEPVKNYRDPAGFPWSRVALADAPVNALTRGGRGPEPGTRGVDER